MGVKAYNLGFAPRLGVAYQLQEHTVVRAGYGRSFSPAGLGAVFGQAPDYDPPVTIPQQVNQNNNYAAVFSLRSEEHTSELQSHSDLVCRLLLEKKKKKNKTNNKETKDYNHANRAA